MIEIVAGDHVPDLPFVIVNREGCHVDGVDSYKDPEIDESSRYNAQ